MTLSEPRSYKKYTKKEGVYIAKREGNYIHGAIYIYISCSNSGVMLTKNHMNNHYFHCSHLNKLKIKTKNNKKIQH